MGGFVAKRGKGGGYGLGSFGKGFPTTHGGGGCCCSGCPCPHHPTQYGLLDAIGGEPNFLGKCRYPGATTTAFNHGKRWRLRVRIEADSEDTLFNPPTQTFTGILRRWSAEYQIQCFRISEAQLAEDGLLFTIEAARQYAQSRYFAPNSNILVELMRYAQAVGTGEAGYWVIVLEPGVVGTMEQEILHPTAPRLDIFDLDTEEIGGLFRSLFGDLLIDYNVASHNEVYDRRFIVNPIAGECEQIVFNAGRFMRETLLRMASTGQPITGDLYCCDDINCIGSQFPMDERDSVYACGGDHQCIQFTPGQPTQPLRSVTEVRTQTGMLAGAMSANLEEIYDLYDGVNVYPQTTRFTGKVQYAVDIIEPCGTDPVESEYVEPPAERDPECTCIEPSSGPTVLLAVPCNTERDSLAYDVTLWDDRPQGAKLIYIEEPDPDTGDPITHCYTPTFVPSEEEPNPDFQWTPSECGEAPCAPPPGFRLALKCTNPNETAVIDTRNAPGGSGQIMARFGLSGTGNCFRVTDEVTEGPQTPGAVVFRTPLGCGDFRCTPSDPEPPDPNDRPDVIPDQLSAPEPPSPDIPPELLQGAVFRRCRGCGG